MSWDEGSGFEDDSGWGGSFDDDDMDSGGGFDVWSGNNLDNPSLNPDWADPSQQQQNQFEFDNARDQNNYFGVGERGLEPSNWYDRGSVMGGNFSFWDSPKDWALGKLNSFVNNPISSLTNVGLGLIPGFGQVAGLNNFSGMMGTGTLGGLAQNVFGPDPQLGSNYTTVASKNPDSYTQQASVPNTFDPGYPTIKDSYGGGYSDPFYAAATQQSAPSLNPAPGMASKDWGQLTFDPMSNQYVYPGA